MTYQQLAIFKIARSTLSEEETIFLMNAALAAIPVKDADEVLCTINAMNNHFKALSVEVA
ncbi:hypothetical protein WB913_002130 [Vibrio parahaemolyticus]|nr:hypothetical protein [Vibrio parahaemolyticus]EGQ9942640.1 hypothetical protein [Vibrio parahaemolyticus]